MRVFVTGAHGHIGSVVTAELLQAGHEVVGLARSEAAEAAVAALGAVVHRGSLHAHDSLRAAASVADGVIHLAFDHAAMLAGDFEGAAATDLAAIKAMAEPLVGTGKPLIGTSGTGLVSVLGLDRPATERDVVPGGYRMDSENAIVALAETGVRGAVVRLPGVVHSDRDMHGFVPMLIASARAAGRSAYVGDGDNHWAACHTLDAAHLYCLALESAPAGSRLHAVGDEGVPFRLIAETIGRHLGLPTESISADEAAAHFGWLAPIAMSDSPATARLTQELLGWAPTHPGLIADLEAGHYFRASS
ncbi:MAG TPA: SDR family oxidoreductase [Acidimicrobiales bacterium]|nr:SDR family oxidoreductase [Acidimicrobiales bacterium]